MDQTPAAASVVSDIHPDDHLYGYLVRRFGEEAARKMYFDGGKADAAQAAATIRRFKKEPNVRVLEFASGYGRITRHLKGLMPDAHLAVSDIHPQACDFVSHVIGVEAHCSSPRPEDLQIGQGYDFIFVISLFSHLPDWSFGRWVDALLNILAPNGILMFTTHGDKSKTLHKGVDFTQHEGGDGWVYIRRSDQPDITDDDYGTMLVEPHYVTRTVSDRKDTWLRAFTSSAWFSHQDEWVFQRIE